MEENMVAEKLGEEAPVTQQSSASPELGSGDTSISTEEAPKPRRRRTRKVTATATAEADQIALNLDSDAPATEPAIKPVRRRRKKAVAETEEAKADAQPETSEAAPASKPHKRRARSSAKAKVEAAATETQGETPTEVFTPDETHHTAAPAEHNTEAAASQADEVQLVNVQSASQATDLEAAIQASNSDQSTNPETAPQGNSESSESAETNEAHAPRRRHRVTARDRDSDARRDRTANVVNNRSRRNNRRNKNTPDRTIEPSLTLESLSEMKVAELREKAAELDVDYVGRRKKELIEEVFSAAAAAEGFCEVDGVVQMQAEGYAFLRTGNFSAGDHDAFIQQQIVRQYGLRPGDRIKGMVGPARSSSKFPPLVRIDTINGKTPEEIKRRPRFRDLTPIYPNERLVMEMGKDSTTGRAIDLVAPIGKGQRGLIVSPPKAGKTTVLKRICQSIAVNNPEVHLFCLLVDERPEEVTDMERSIRGTVVASTFDMPASNHTAVAEMVIDHAKRLVELGEDVVVVLDSITRLARAYNLAQPASGRILSGGVDSAALYPPKKFLGAARNIEGGGSLTILASALVDTGSKMDEVIFEEFKGTGNMELKLDRDLADRRIFPAIDPVASGTRNEDLLIDAQIQPFVWGIRRILANMNNTERAATALVKGLKATNNNEEFLIRSAKKAAQSDYLS
ncbi:transcription termination factor Rho [uncultured Olegusella sp.]|uniref:transcription termination factor Rho n=1 Tax=uncultured Olegusella sp. TaxID=1979846 RepID=UPI0026314978|nr:transcription termination factor Rho [uncultured Olegusella sp.]